MAETDETGLWIVVPAYNEGRAIESVLAELSTRYANIVVVDDGSRDDTSARSLSAGAFVVRHHINLGQGAAIQTGFDFVLARGARFVATFDADGQHSVDDMATMLAELERTRADVALGSRFLGAGIGLGRARRVVLKLAILQQRLVTGLKLTDAHNGLRVFTAAAARRIRIRQNRMAHASEIISQIATLQLRVIEVPCTIRYTEYSKAKGQKLTGALRILWDLAIRSLYR
jgi:glycosyltransferase involved in cell wall biosynthesis